MSGAIFSRPNGGKYSICPYWDEKNKRLLFVDADQMILIRWDISTGKLQGAEELKLQDKWGKRDKYLPIAFAIPYEYDRHQMVANKNNFLNWVDFQKDKSLTQTLVIMEIDIPGNTMTCGKCDSMGRLFVGTAARDKAKRDFQGFVYSLTTPEMEIKKHDKDLMYPTGIAFSKDEKIIFVSEARKANTDEPGFIYKLEYDVKSGKSKNKTTFVDILKKQKKLHNFYELGSPFGLTVDADNRLWSAMCGNGLVICWDINKTDLLVYVRIAIFPLMTDVCFGGENFDQMFITTDGINMTEQHKKLVPDSKAAGGIIQFPTKYLPKDFAKTKGMAGKAWSSKSQLPATG